MHRLGSRVFLKNVPLGNFRSRETEIFATELSWAIILVTFFVNTQFSESKMHRIR